MAASMAELLSIESSNEFPLAVYAVAASGPTLKKMEEYLAKPVVRHN